MAGGFGGAVKLTGESEYKRALAQINQALRETASEMKKVTSEFATNDKSQDAVTAKAEVLNRKLEEQKQKVSILKDEYKRMADEYSKNKDKHEELVSEYEKEKQKLSDIESSLGKTSDEYQEQKKVVDQLSEEVEKSTKAQDANEQSMSKMRVQINEAQTACNKTANEIEKLGDATEEAGKDAEKSSLGVEVLAETLGGLATSAIQSALSGLKKLSSAMIGMGKQALDNYANYEQLVGGVETLFGESAPIVEKYASEAYKTAGMSANEYMETVTSFSASLIQSLDGDTAKAGEVANRAISDMADNANKMGTSMDSIQNAYQGFAKQNYTMLDNLKLGYGGTKKEMERLIKDASQMTDVQKELGVTVDESDMSFSNIANAISVVQKNMGIMGTTAKEADGTIQGSTYSMRSAWQNLLTGIADDNADFGELVSVFTTSLMQMLSNTLPRVQTIIQGMAKMAGEMLNTIVPELMDMIPPLLEDTLPMLIEAIKSMLLQVALIIPEILPVVMDGINSLVSSILDALPFFIAMGIRLIKGLAEGITDAIPELLAMIPSLIQNIVEVFMDGGVADLIDTGTSLLLGLIDGLVDAIPILIDMLPQIIDTIVFTLIQELPRIIDSGIKILLAIINGIIKTLPQLVRSVPQIIKAVVKTLSDMMPFIVESGVKLITFLVKGIVDSIKHVVSGVQKIGKSVIDTLKTFISKVVDVGVDLVKGIWQGISNSVSWLKEKISGWVGNVTSFIKNLFGINSPSRLFRDEIGENLALGIGEGFTNQMKNVSSDMADAIPKSFDVETSIKGSAQNNPFDMVGAFKQALSEVKIVLDDQVAGEFVDKTVTKLVYM